MKREELTQMVSLSDFHQDFYTYLCELRDRIASETNENEIVDVCYILREMYKIVDDLRKEVKSLDQRAQRVACLVLMKKQIEDDVSTPWCKGTPDVKFEATLPTRRKDPEGFRKLMEHFGVSEEAYDRDRSAIKPHWPGMVDLLSELMESGRPLPPGIDPSKTWPVYSLSVRKVRELPKDIVAIDESELFVTKDDE